MRMKENICRLYALRAEGEAMDDNRAVAYALESPGSYNSKPRAERGQLSSDRS
jgi:hypothetical protein